MARYEGPRAQITLTTGAELYLEGSADDLREELAAEVPFVELRQTSGVPLHVRPAHVVAIAPLPDA